MSVRTGLDRVARESKSCISGRRVALLAHPASVDRDLRHARQVLENAGADIRVIFGPEHGYAGTAQDMIGVDGGREDDVRLVSLYGSSAADLQPKPGDFADVEAVVIDLQDVGSRYYTYVWTAAFMLRAASKAGVQTIVLDRPNPLGGIVVEGAPQRPGYRSFVGLYDVAVRHGMTLAEILTLVCERESIDPKGMQVVEMEGWSRDMWFDQTGLPWVMPSPNMPNLETAVVYPGGCIIEGTTLSEGRGTTRPFEIFGGPFQRPPEWPVVEGAALRPLTFEPTFQKHARSLCGGVQVHVLDREVFRSQAAYLRWIAAALEALPGGTAPWRTEEYEYETSRPAIDLLTGGPEYRQLVNAGEDLDDYLADDRRAAQSFAADRERFLRY